MIFDTHAHYDSKEFDSNRDELLKDVFNNNVSYIVNVGSDLQSCEKCIGLSQQYENIYAAIGIHPTDTIDLTEDNFERIVKKYVECDKVVAVGEIGLDYYWEKEEAQKNRQKKWFEKQIQLAKDINKPVIIHSREAAKDTLDIIKESDAQKVGGVIHCFSYEKEMAREYIKLGFYIGIGGVLTYKNARKQKEVVEDIPLDRIVLETDAPYLTPVPFRGKTNNSSYIKFVVEEIARIKNVSEKEVENITLENAKRMYRL